MTRRSWLGLGVLGTIVVVMVFVWLYRYEINDWYVLRSYQPSSEIQELADNSSMSDYGKQLFYVGKPKITGGEEFNNKCRDFEETKVLGCIVSGYQTGLSLFSVGGYEIYVLNVTEPNLSGIQEVTAAHEMLHAAYGRLSPGKKSEIDAEIARVYAKLNNDKLRQVIESYPDNDQSVISNELHSLLGTEVANIGSVLEKYYSQYFNDRSKVVAIYEDYEAVFEKAKSESETLYASIKLLENQIIDKRVALDKSASDLEQQRNRLEELRISGDIRAYNSQAPIYNQQVNAYNLAVAEIKLLFEKYNQLVAEYDDLVVKQKQLVDAIDSNVIPETKL